MFGCTGLLYLVHKIFFILIDLVLKLCRNKLIICNAYFKDFFENFSLGSMEKETI